VNGNATSVVPEHVAKGGVGGDGREDNNLGSGSDASMGGCGSGCGGPPGGPPPTPTIPPSPDALIAYVRSQVPALSPAGMLAMSASLVVVAAFLLGRRKPGA